MEAVWLKLVHHLGHPGALSKMERRFQMRASLVEAWEEHRMMWADPSILQCMCIAAKIVLQRAHFVEGVDGPSFVGPPLREELQQQCQYILAFNGWVKRKSNCKRVLLEYYWSLGFAGSQPVSMDVQNIGLLSQKPYRVSWKADGTRYCCDVVCNVLRFICRYIMYIRKEGEIYMLDRDNAVFSIPKLQFPSRKHVGQHIKDTLVDGVSWSNIQ